MVGARERDRLSGNFSISLPYTSWMKITVDKFYCLIGHVAKQHRNMTATMKRAITHTTHTEREHGRVCVDFGSLTSLRTYGTRQSTHEYTKYLALPSTYSAFS